MLVSGRGALKLDGLLLQDEGVDSLLLQSLCCCPYSLQLSCAKHWN